jgi:hypothetical protein
LPICCLPSIIWEKSGQNDGHVSRKFHCLNSPAVVQCLTRVAITKSVIDRHWIHRFVLAVDLGLFSRLSPGPSSAWADYIVAPFPTFFLSFFPDRRRSMHFHFVNFFHAADEEMLRPRNQVVYQKENWKTRRSNRNTLVRFGLMTF